jgi:hypothetical protein
MSRASLRPVRPKRDNSPFYAKEPTSQVSRVPFTIVLEPIAESLCPSNQARLCRLRWTIDRFRVPDGSGQSSRPRAALPPTTKPHRPHFPFSSDVPDPTETPPFPGCLQRRGGRAAAASDGKLDLDRQHATCDAGAAPAVAPLDPFAPRVVRLWTPLYPYRASTVRTYAYRALFKPNLPIIGGSQYERFDRRGFEV